MRRLLVLPVVLLLACGFLRAQDRHYLNPETIMAVVRALPEPPNPRSLEAEADLEAVLQVQAWRTPEQVAFAKQIDGWDVYDYTGILGAWFKPSQVPACNALLRSVEADMLKASSLAKKRFERPRPPYVDARVKPCVEVPSRGSHSYPSGHSTAIHLEAFVLAEVFLEFRDALLAYADRAAWSRTIAGVHFPSDDVAGRHLATALLSELKKNPDFLAALERCRAEGAPLTLKKAG
jgi:acid phosphatase (class A)